MAKPTKRRGAKPQLSLLESARHMIELRLDGLLAYDVAIGQPNAVIELHEMRIAAKRLRYTLEIFQEVYERYTPHGAMYGKIIDEVKSLQEQLGFVHDADILVPEMAAQLVDLLTGDGNKRDPLWPPGVHYVDFDACDGLLSLCRQMRSSRDLHYREAAGIWARLREAQHFTTLREMLHHAITDRNERASAAPQHAAGAMMTEDTGYGRPTQITPTPKGESTNRQRVGRTKSGRGRTDDTKNGVRHTGPGADPGTSVDEGRVE